LSEGYVWLPTLFRQTVPQSVLNMAKSQNWPEVTLAAFYSHGINYYKRVFGKKTQKVYRAN